MSYRRIPFGNQPLEINEDADLVNRVTGVVPTIHTTWNGYRRFWVKEDEEYKSYSLHRAVAILFVERPDRHKDVPFSELQVNHIDGNKSNNASSNLEWVNGKENMEHARAIGLFSNNKSVLARNVETNEILEFKSISELGRSVFIQPNELSRHLHSVCAGAVVVDGLVFKFNDCMPWPTLLAYDGRESTLGRVCDLVAENMSSGIRVLFASLPEACGALGLNVNVVKNTRTRKGKGFPCDDWIFYPLA